MEEPLADINVHMHKLSSVLESLVIDLRNQGAHMHAKARGTTSAGVDNGFLSRCMVFKPGIENWPAGPHS